MDRLTCMLKADSTHVSEQMLKLLESEISKVVKNFVSLSGEVVVRYKLSPNGLKFMVEFEASGLRPLGFIPKN